MRFGRIAALWIATIASSLHAQSAWEVTPYAARVWVAVEDQPDLPIAWRAELPDELNGKLQGVFHAVWDGLVEPASMEIRHGMLTRLADVSRKDVFRADSTADHWDKLFLVAITQRLGSFRIQVRQFDCRLSYFGPCEESQVDLLELVPSRIVQLVARAFSPVVRIDRTADGRARTRLRAGWLIRRPESPAMVRQGDVLLPFERRTSSVGTVNLGDVRTIDWTYLVVQEQVGSTIDCQIVTGFYQPLRSRPSRRVQ